MHDAVALERRGIPVAAVVTEPFARAFAQTAELLGAPDLRCVVIPHPLATLEEPEIEERIEPAVEQVVALLRGSSGC